MYSGDEFYGDEITSSIDGEEAVLLRCPRCGVMDDAPWLWVSNGGQRRCDLCWEVMVPEDPDFTFSEPEWNDDFDVSSALASAGWGTDEDYGCFGEE
ncbi:MAG: hypothetical protein KA419_13925 [Acidobacteria bacterium]|nr:hypothetical protein [Acidobacteriota bacterium]